MIYCKICLTPYLKKYNLFQAFFAISFLKSEFSKILQKLTQILTRYLKVQQSIYLKMLTELGISRVYTLPVVNKKKRLTWSNFEVW